MNAKGLLFLLLLLMGMRVANAQTVADQSWQQVMDEVMAIDGDDETTTAEALEESYDLLEQLAESPLDLNHATREELEQLPFLTAQQVMDIEEYLYRYGPMRSLGELRMVRSLDYQQLRLLPFFVMVSDEPAESPHTFPRLDTLLSRSRHTLTTTLRVPFYQRRGDRNGYLGYPYRHTLRYELKSGNHLRLGLVGAQDAGEPFFAKGNGWGYDTYSYYVQLKQLGRLANLVAGKYKLSAGMGLVLGHSFQLGKLATLQNLGRSVATLRPHGSRSEADYFQGAAATIDLIRPGLSRKAGDSGNVELQLTPFLSWRTIDATLTSDSTSAQTLITSGYHRTPTEMNKKGNTSMVDGGAHLALRYEALRLGLTAVATRLSRPLEPQRETLYRRHYAHGQHFVNVSADYAYRHHRWALSGETATDGYGHLATINSLSLQPAAHLGLILLQRFYSFRYTTLHGHSFAAGSRTQNESGIYLGATWQPLARLRLQAYADYAYFAWARYLVSQSSHAADLLLQATWQHRRWTLQARHRTQLRQRDNADKSALLANNDHRERLSVTYTNDPLTLKTQVDLARVFYKQADRGWMLSQQVLYSKERVQLGAMAAYFDTDSYQSRIYVYERQLQHEFYFPTYYGNGLRLVAQARIDILPTLRIALRLGYTNYFDRPTIGTGLQEIAHSSTTDLDVQLRWKF